MEWKACSRVRGHWLASSQPSNARTWCRQHFSEVTARILIPRSFFLRPAQQLDVELAAGEQHVVQRFADIAGFD